MKDIPQFSQIRDEHNRLKADFIRVELALAITFCEVALHSTSDITRNRNTENARRAYTSASNALAGAYLERKERQEIDGQMAEVEALMRGASMEAENETLSSVTRSERASPGPSRKTSRP